MKEKMLDNQRIGSKRKNYNSFDIAKFICAILVVMIHVAPFASQEISDISSNINFLLQQGVCRIAVPLFFIFNGFFLSKKILIDDFSWKHIKKYVLHILAMYLFWSLLYFSIKYTEILRKPKGILFGWMLYIKDLICVGSYTHLWYLNALIWAVVIISFLLFNKVQLKKYFSYLLLVI